MSAHATLDTFTGVRSEALMRWLRLWGCIEGFPRPCYRDGYVVAGRNRTTE